MRPELTRKDVAAGITTMGALVRQRDEIGARLDQTIDEVGRLYGDLSRVNKAIGQELFHTGACPGNAPAWLADSTTAYRLRNRLGAACAPHSAGGANESPFGLVQCRLPLREVFAKDHAGVVAGR